jgi:hypothetical protein
LGTQITGPYSLEGGASWYFGFMPTALPDDRLPYFLALSSASPLNAGVVTSEVGVTREFDQGTSFFYFQFGVLVENRNAVPVTFNIAIYQFKD